jgi:hypothetical protein
VRAEVSASARQTLPGGRLFVATSDANLRVLRFKYKTGADATSSVEQEHDLAGLTPRPGPAPSWAKAGLV